MLLTKTVKVKWNGASRKWYESKGYKFTKLKDEFEVEIEDTTPNCKNVNIVLQCDNCKIKTKRIDIYALKHSKIYKNGKYICKNCKQKIKENLCCSICKTQENITFCSKTNTYLCSKHRHEIDRYSKIRKDKEKIKICSVDGCKNKHFGNGYCQRHYNQIKKYGRILYELDKPRICEICGSNKNVELHRETKMMLCGKHYQQYMKYGRFFRSVYDPNKYILYKDYAEILLYNIEGIEIARAIIDLEDVEKCKKYKWHLGDTGYVLSCIDGFNIRLHKFVLDEYEDYKGHDFDNMTDHIDRDKLNNCKNNLRKVTDSQNKQNRDLLKNNTTGRTCLQYLKKENLWRIDLRIKEIKITKTFKSRKEAEYILDLYELYYKPYCPHYEALKQKYKNIYDDLMKYGVEKYIELNNIMDWKGRIFNVRSKN